MTRSLWPNLPEVLADEQAVGEEDGSQSRAIEIQALRMCLRHLVRDAQVLQLEGTAQLLVAAIQSLDSDTSRQMN